MSGTTEVSLRDAQQERSIHVLTGSTVVEAVSSTPEFSITAACGGNGTCGKCRVVIEGEGVSPPDEIEKSFLSGDELERGIRLGCRAHITGPCTVYLDTAEIENLPELQTSPVRPLVSTPDPPVRVQPLTLAPPTLEDQRTDEERLWAALTEGRGASEPGLAPELLRELPSALRKHDFRISVLRSDLRLYRILPGAKSSRLGIAVDIGTTSLAVYLLDTGTGEILGSLSRRNRQSSFGGDVISRISAFPEHGERMRRSLIDQIEEMSGELSGELDGVTAVCAVGNTVMLHLLTGLDPTGIGEAPFIPVSTAYRELSAEEAAFSSLSCPLMVLPSVSGYIGSDITAGVVASGMQEEDQTALLIDIGTNGEIVLKRGGEYFACSAAAGPAFEGAGIACGMGYDHGAVEAVGYGEEGMHYSVVGGAATKGLCGSGILDSAAALLEAGWAEPTGRMLSEAEIHDEEVEMGGAARIVEEEGEPRLLFSSNGPDTVYFSQRDMRQVQNAKAAVAAGIRTLLLETGVEPEEVEKVYLAGGFGSFLRPQSAVRIGMIPAEMEARIEQMGNTAGKGAVLALLSRERLRRIDEVSRQIRYIELSADKRFMELYVDEMFFPEHRGGKR
jgi:uncharacterized 2Fe-2S/4Fe-4S cluster protein (DUF4445 family)